MNTATYILLGAIKMLLVLKNGKNINPEELEILIKGYRIGDHRIITGAMVYLTKDGKALEAKVTLSEGFFKLHDMNREDTVERVRKSINKSRDIASFKCIKTYEIIYEFKKHLQEKLKAMKINGTGNVLDTSRKLCLKTPLSLEGSLFCLNIF